MALVFIVEDDNDIRQIEAYALKCGGLKLKNLRMQKHFTRDWKENARSFLLDVMLPDGNGYDFCREIREADNYVPVIFLTAVSDEVNLVQGLELGADDYIAKPYRVKELLTRISAILRRQRYNNIKKTDLDNEAGEDFVFGHIRLDNKQYKIYRNERNIDCTPSEFRLLRELTLHENQVMTRRQLIERLWDVDESFVDDNTLSVYIKRLRDKLEEDSAYIRTVRGIGYMFVPDSANK